MEKQDSVDQRRARLEQFLLKNADKLRGQGAIVASYRQRGVRRTGPYYRLTCRDAEGRQRAFYLGAESRLVQEARDRLQALQNPHRLRLVLRRARFAVRQAARLRRADDNLVLANWGLTYKGRELRGRLTGALQGITERIEATGAAEARSAINAGIAVEIVNGTP